MITDGTEVLGMKKGDVWMAFLTVLAFLVIIGFCIAFAFEKDNNLYHIQEIGWRQIASDKPEDITDIGLLKIMVQLDPKQPHKLTPVYYGKYLPKNAKLWQENNLVYVVSYKFKHNDRPVMHFVKMTSLTD